MTGMTAIRQLLILFLLILFALGVYSQNNGIKPEVRINKYFVDSITFNQIDLLYTNSSGSSCILWIEKTKVDSLSNNDKIRNYFYKRKGDFTLSELAYEHLANEIPIELFNGLIGIIV